VSILNGVQIRTRRSALTEKVQREVMETVVLRNEEVVVVLSEGDPLAYVFKLSTGELLELRDKLRPILGSRPQLRSLLEALIQYRRQCRRRNNHRSIDNSWNKVEGREAFI
jgi:hypothetical protein